MLATIPGRGWPLYLGEVVHYTWKTLSTIPRRGWPQYQGVERLATIPRLRCRLCLERLTTLLRGWPPYLGEVILNRGAELPGISRPYRWTETKILYRVLRKCSINRKLQETQHYKKEQFHKYIECAVY
jgi:hypothetical protein